MPFMHATTLLCMHTVIGSWRGYAPGMKDVISLRMPKLMSVSMRIAAAFLSP